MDLINEKKKILHIVVNYKNDEETLSFIENLSQQINFKGNVTLYVANNSASSINDLTFQSKLKTPDIHVHNLPENPGYFGAAHTLLKQKILDPMNYEWVIISNSDIELKTPFFYKQLLQFQYNKISNIGLLAPSIISGISNLETNPFMKSRPSKLRMNFYKIIFSNYVTCQFYQFLGFIKDLTKNILFKKPHSTERQTSHDAAESIYAAHGSFMIFNQLYFKSGLNLDHPCFLYGEEIATAEKCLQMNLKIYFYPQLKLLHKEHGSEGIKSFLFNKKTFQFKRDSSKVLYELYFK